MSCVLKELHVACVELFSCDGCVFVVVGMLRGCRERLQNFFFL